MLTVDKHTADPVAMETLQGDEMLTQPTELRQVEDLNHVIEHDHRNIKRIIRPMMGCQSFSSARRTLRVIEAMSILRKEQVKGVEPEHSVSQARLIEESFEIAA